MSAASFVFAFALLVFAAPLPVAAKTSGSPEAKKIAVITTVYFHNSHADLIASRLFQTYTLDGKGESPRLKLASLYVDQFPKNDISRKFAEQYRSRSMTMCRMRSRSAPASWR